MRLTTRCTARQGQCLFEATMLMALAMGLMLALRSGYQWGHRIGGGVGGLLGTLGGLLGYAGGLYGAYKAASLVESIAKRRNVSRAVPPAEASFVERHSIHIELLLFLGMIVLAGGMANGLLQDPPPSTDPPPGDAWGDRCLLMAFGGSLIILLVSLFGPPPPKWQRAWNVTRFLAMKLAGLTLAVGLSLELRHALRIGLWQYSNSAFGFAAISLLSMYLLLWDGLSFRQHLDGQLRGGNERFVHHARVLMGSALGVLLLILTLQQIWFAISHPGPAFRFGGRRVSNPPTAISRGGVPPAGT